MAALTVILPDDLRDLLDDRAKVAHRSVGAEIRFLVEQAIRQESCKEAKELSAFIHGCPAAKAIEAMTEAQA